MSKEIRIAIAGIGNCCSSLIQGLFYYKNVNSNDKPIPGLMHNVLGGYKISDVKPVAAFDVDKRKIGKDLSQAIFEKPNCTKVFHKDVPNMGIKVNMTPVMDGVAGHMDDYEDHRAFRVSNDKPVDVVKILKETKADMLINYLPVGSEDAVKYLAQCALDAGIAFINCMPVFIASTPEWSKKFEEKGIPCCGDDIKAQVGSTIIHRTLAKLFSDRGVTMTGTYQLNVGGNTDFLNMYKAHERLKSKKESKTGAVQSNLPTPLHKDLIHIGPSDYVPWLYDNKLGFIRIEGLQFGDVPMNLEMRLSVEDSPNSAGCVIDAIRGTKLAIDRNISGSLISLSSYLMKHPMTQYPDDVAKRMVEEFIKGERER